MRAINLCELSFEYGFCEIQEFAGVFRCLVAEEESGEFTAILFGHTTMSFLSKGFRRFGSRSLHSELLIEILDFSGEQG